MRMIAWNQVDARRTRKAMNATAVAVEIDELRCGLDRRRLYERLSAMEVRIVVTR